jgi:hypothetical protein
LELLLRDFLIFDRQFRMIKNVGHFAFGMVTHLQSGLGSLSQKGEDRSSIGKRCGVEDVKLTVSDGVWFTWAKFDLRRPPREE